MPPLVALDQVSYGVAGQTILDSVSLALHRGQIVGILGLSGSGKTTLLRLVVGLLRPTSGQVVLFGQPTNDLSDAALDASRLRIGLVFQYAALFDSLTVAENVAFPLREHPQNGRLGKRSRQREAALRERVASLLQMVGMSGTEHLYPAQLSGGMRKRVGIARALALEPEVMLYDEPSSGLDPLTAAMIDDLIVELSNTLSVASLVVSHHVANVMRIAHLVGFLHEARLAFWGTPEEARLSSVPIVQAFLRGRQEPVRA